MNYFILVAPLLLIGCTADRQLYEFDKLTFTTESQFSEAASQSSLPTVWRGRKLYRSPWAYIYATDKECAVHVYDKLAEHSKQTETPKSSGLIVVTSSKDTEPAFDYYEIKLLYDNYLKSQKLSGFEKEIFKRDLKWLKYFVNKNIKKKHDIFSHFSFFIQPEIMQIYLNAAINDSIYWCGFVTLDEAMNETVDVYVDKILDDKAAGFATRILCKSIVFPIVYYAKKELVKLNEEAFAVGYRRNVFLNHGTVKFSDKVIDVQPRSAVDE